MNGPIASAHSSSKKISFYRSYNYTVSINQLTGLSFHGFFELLFCLGERKYPGESLDVSLSKLLHYCDTQMRYNGVRSGRLRAETVDDLSTYPIRHFYLMPHRCAFITKIRKITAPN